MTTEFDNLMMDVESRTELCAELAAVRVSELIARQMEKHGLNRTEFAKLLNVSPGRVTQILDADTNLQLRTVAKALAVFELVLDVGAVPLASLSCPQNWEPAPQYPASISTCGVAYTKVDDNPADSNYSLAA